MSDKKSDVDMVNHPPHYKNSPSGVECIQITEHMNFNIGNAVKYLWRAGSKGSAVVDLKKAEWYINREIQRLISLAGPRKGSDLDVFGINDLQVSGEEASLRRKDGWGAR